MRRPPSKNIRNLTTLMSPAAVNLVSAKGPEVVRQIGLDVVRAVVYDVLSGKNVRDSTEMLTRRRIASLNLALLSMFLAGSSRRAGFVRDLPKIAAQILKRKRVSESERWIAQWILGLTDKAFQNVLRDDPNSLMRYRDRYITVCREVVEQCEDEQGELSGLLELQSGDKAEVNWLFITYLLNAVGAQTLAIRGSDKSTYGKLFGKVVLGALLHILGFRYVSAAKAGRLRRVFWLSTRGDRRESDATLLYEAGKGVRIDIGFIGRGNPEISLDKVSRFEREISVGRSKWYMATLIIVDRIGPRSRIPRLAEEVGGTIVQMSMAYWPQHVAQVLKRVLGYEHVLAEMGQRQIGPYLRAQLRRVPLEKLCGVKTG